MKLLEAGIQVTYGTWTGFFWRGLPAKSLNEKGKKRTGGKQSKQRNTWAFFVNAAGGKQQPNVTGKSQKPKCFKKLENKTSPCSCQYFANSKAWMNNEIMSEVLSRLNRRLKRQKRNILLFMDNAPWHPESHQHIFSNIKIVFLPKNTTSKTQPLDAGIIANWKIHYKKRLLHYICGDATSSSCASEIVKSVNLLMAIEWGKQAWDDLAGTTITKCFKKTGLYVQIKEYGICSNPN